MFVVFVLKVKVYRIARPEIRKIQKAKIDLNVFFVETEGLKYNFR
jgi:hypothetical protein